MAKRSGIAAASLFSKKNLHTLLIATAVLSLTSAMLFPAMEVSADGLVTLAGQTYSLASHPRLIVGADVTLEQLMARANSSNKYWNMLIDGLASKRAANPNYTASGSDFANYDFLLGYALAYMVDPARYADYGRAVREIFLAYPARFSISGHGNTGYADFSRYHIASLALAYDWAGYRVLSTAEKRAFLSWFNDQLYPLAKSLYDVTDSWGSTHNLNHTHAWALIAAGLAFYEDNNPSNAPGNSGNNSQVYLDLGYSIWSKWSAKANQYYVGGHSWGGQDYGNGRSLRFALHILHMLNSALGLEEWSKSSYPKDVIRYWIHSTFPRQLGAAALTPHTYSDGNIDGEDWGYRKSAIIIAAAAHYPDSEEAAMGYFFLEQVIRPSGTNRDGYYIPSQFRWEWFLFADPTAQQLDYRAQEPSAYLSSGVDLWFSRSGWYEPQATHVSLAAATFLGDHQGLNPGSYKIYKGGHLLYELGPSGNGMGAQTNILFLDDGYIRDKWGNKRQTGGLNTANPSLTPPIEAEIDRAENSQPGYAYARADLSRAYWSGKIERFTRSLVHLKPSQEMEQDYIVVHDRVRSVTGAGSIQGEVQKAAYLYFPEKPVASGSQLSVASDRGNSKLVMQILEPSSPTISMSQMDGALTRGSLSSDNPWRVSLRAPQAKQYEEFLLVYMPTTNLSASLPKLTKIVSRNVIGVQIADGDSSSVVIFGHSADGADIQGAISYQFDPSSNPQHIVTDLAPGATYDVQISGATVTLIPGSHFVVPASGALRFDSSASGADTIAPTVSLSLPTTGQHAIGQLALAATAQDNVGVSKVQFYINNNLVAESTTAPYQSSIDISSYTPGPYSLSARAYDAAGNIGDSESITFFVDALIDQTPPTITIRQPGEGQQVPKRFTIAVDARDNVAVSRVAFYINGAQIGQSAAAPFSLAADLSSFSEGPYKLSAEAYDTSNNRSISQEVQITVVASAPGGPDKQPVSGKVMLTLTCVGASQNNAPVFVGAPFAPGVIFDEAQIKLSYAGAEVPRQTSVLSRYRDGSLRVILIGLRITLAAGESKALAMSYNQGAGAAVSPAMPWSYNSSVVPSLPPGWYSQSGVFGHFLPSADNIIFPGFESRMMSRLTPTSDPPQTTDRNFYDHMHATHMVFLRDGNRRAYQLARDEVLLYREKEIIHSGANRGQYFSGAAIPIPISVIRRMYPEGLLEDYYLTGDPRSLEVAREIADALAADVLRSQSRFVRTERTPGFALVGLLSFYEATLEEKYLDAAKVVAEIVMDHQDAMAIKYPRYAGAFLQDPWFDPSETGIVGGSPWMTTILCEGLIKYYHLTGEERAKRSVQRAVDWLVNVAYSAADKSYWYAAVDKALGVTLDLNPMMLEMLGFAWQLTGNSTYKDQALSVLQPNIWGGRIKSFNQAMRSSGRGLKLLQEPAGAVKLVRGDIGAPQNAAPTAFISASVTGGSSPLTVQFTGSGSDSDGQISGYFWSFGDGGTSTDQNPSHTYTSTGVFEVKLTVTDNRGATASAVITITVSGPDLPPTVEITSPLPGQEVFGDLLLSANAQDERAVARVEFFINNTLVGRATSAPYQTTINVSSYAPGLYTLIVVAYDNTGNSGVAPPVSFTVVPPPPPDVTAPTVSITSPATGQEVSGKITVSAQAQDDRGVARVEFYLSGNLVGQDTTAPYQISLDLSNRSAGQYSLEARAYDATGNRGTSAPVLIIVKATSPGQLLPGNMVVNPSFELDMSSWRNSTAAVTVIASTAINGQKAVRIQTDAYEGISQYVYKALKGGSLELTAWVRWASGSKGAPELRAIVRYTDDSTQTFQFRAPSAWADGNWHQIRATINLSSTRATSYIIVNPRAATSQAQSWDLDLVQCRIVQ